MLLALALRALQGSTKRQSWLQAGKQGVGARASMNSVPAALKKGTPASPAIALASSVLPAHGAMPVLLLSLCGAWDLQ